MATAMEAYEALSAEDLEREDVKAALQLLDEAVKALGSISTLDETVPVAKIGDAKYATLDEAVAAAGDGAVIELLADCETEGLNLKNDLTINGNGRKISFASNGIYARNCSLSFVGCVVDMSINNNPSGSGATANLIDDSDLSFIGSTVNIRSAGGNGSAIYLYQGSNLYIDGSAVSISGFNGGSSSGIYADGSEREGGLPSFQIVISNGSGVDISNCAWGGMTVNPCDVTVTGNSKLTISGCGVNDGRQGLGCYYGTLKVLEGSTVNSSNNVGRSWGIFVGGLQVDGSSSVITNGNTGSGLVVGGRGDITPGAKIESCDNSGAGLWVYVSGTTWVGDVSISEGANVSILRNSSSGIFNAGTLVMNSGTVMNNSTSSAGGGIYSSKNAELGSAVILYNNHAAVAGDDIYVDKGGSISFGAVGDGWTLDDCSHAIDGWYDDSANITEGNSTTYKRWNAHDSAKEHIVLNAPGSYTGVTALKAAHGAVPPAEPLPWPESPENISRSKTATNLDANFESTVTLGLPAAQQQLVSDVVFVLDKSTSAQVESQVLDMLSQLNEQIRGSSAAVKVGVIIFNKQANIELELTELNDQNLPAIQTAIKTEISSGTNTHAGLLAGKAMLDADTSVDAGRKYLIFVSDGISYIFDAEANSINSQQMTTGEYAVMAGPDCWGIRHYQEGGQSYVPADFGSYLGAVGRDLSMVQQYIQPYASASSNQDLHIPRENGTAYPSCVDVALYKTALAYQSAVGSGYNCYAVTADTGSGGANPWGPAFMGYLAQGQSVSFESIKNDILYLLSVGSTVEDYIGSGKDNKGKDYNMDFVNDISRLSLTVGGVELDKVKIEDNKYGFGAKDDSYRFVLEYFPDSAAGAGDEHFVWYINESIKITQPVQLSYVVKLSNPQTVEGTYGEYDANGSQGKTALYTNKSATLFPVDSQGNPGIPQDFPKPTVSYTVAPTLISVSVTKVWNDQNDNDGLRPDSLKVSLYADNVNTGKYIVLNAENKWQGSFEDLPATDQGKLIKYEVYEETVSGYTAQEGISETDDGFAVTLTNTHTVETVSIPVQKIWQDNNNLNGRRPHSVTIYLYANGDYTGETLVLRSRDNWAGSFDNLPKYINGQLIEYTVREKSMYYYNGKVSANPNGGFTVTNYYTTTPGTGDSSRLWLWTGLSAGSLAALGAVAVKVRRRKGKSWQ